MTLRARAGDLDAKTPAAWLGVQSLTSAWIQELAAAARAWFSTHPSGAIDRPRPGGPMVCEVLFVSHAASLTSPRWLTVPSQPS